MGEKRRGAVRRKPSARKRETPDKEVRHMVRLEDVSLRQPKGGAKMRSFRLPSEAISYYEGEAKATGRGKVDVVVEALYLDRDIGRRLAGQRVRLEQMANAMGLDLSHDLAEVLAKLVEMGLDAAEAKGAPETSLRHRK